MSGHNKQKKTSNLLQGDVNATGKLTLNIKGVVEKVPLETSIPELYNSVDRTAIIEQLENEKEVINKLLDRFTNNSDRVG